MFYLYYVNFDTAPKQLKSPQTALLSSQYWKPEATTTKTTGPRSRYVEIQRIKPKERLEIRCGSDTILLKSNLYTKDCHNQNYKQVS